MVSLGLAPKEKNVSLNLFIKLEEKHHASKTSTHHLRPGRCRRMARAGPDPPFPAGVGAADGGGAGEEGGVGGPHYDYPQQTQHHRSPGPEHCRGKNQQTKCQASF